MSGITGLYHLDGRSADTQRLHQMTQVLVHRGGVATCWTEGSVGLGVQKRPEGARDHSSPRTLTTGPFALVADARIDNRDDLLRTLGRHDRPDEEVTDEALILAAYERWGEDCAEHLIGAFAFALWDGRSHTLFCARDHFGRRPLYYARTDDGFFFASEIKALLLLPDVTHRINEVRVADYLTNASHDPSATFYADISRLPAASTLRVTPDGVRLRKYWRLDPNREVHYPSDDAYAEAFRERFTASVHACMRSPHRVGTMLSGGLDSSSITCVARDLLGASDTDPLDTFSSVYDALPQCDEREYIDAVLAQGGLRPHYHLPDQHSLLEDLDQMLWHVEEPFFTPNLYQPWHLWKEADKAGVRVVLDGFLGDNVVNHGSPYLTELAASFRWGSLARETRQLSALRGGGDMQRRLIQHFAIEPLVLEPLRMARRRFKGIPLHDLPFTRYLHPDFARRVGLRGRAESSWQRQPRSVREEQHNDLTSPLLTEALEITNKAAAAFGVEPRFPFTDRRLMEFCFALPSTQRYRNGQARFVLHHALRDVLPEKIYRRQGKADISPNYARSLFELGRTELDSLIHERLEVTSAYLDVEAVKDRYEVMTDFYDREKRLGARALPFGLIAILTRWLENHRDRPNPNYPPVFHTQHNHHLDAVAI